MTRLVKILLVLFVLPMLHGCSKDESGDTVSEYYLGEASYYPSFLWSKEKCTPLEKSLVLTFNEGALRDESSAELQIVGSDGHALSPNDYTIIADGFKIEDGVIPISAYQKEIKLQFVPSSNLVSCHTSGYIIAKSTKRLDRIYGAVDDVILKWNFKFHRGYNPLAVVIICLLGGFLLFLLLWLLLFKRIFFSTIKAAKITMTGPDGYYRQLRIKGKRKVILTSKKRNCNILDRVFTGEILFIIAPHFVPEIEIAPTIGKKKGISLKSMGVGADKWIFSPSAVLRPYEKTKVSQTQTKQKFEIELS